jgi:NADP-reducing hydrogenase subunit HndB
MAERIESPKDLNALRDRARAEIDIRTGPKEIQITVHMGTTGIAAGARDILMALMDELSRASANNVTLRQAGGLGLCAEEPMITLTDKGGKEFLYGKLDTMKIHQIVQDHVLGGRPVPQYIVNI